MDLCDRTYKRLWTKFAGVKDLLRMNFPPIELKTI